MDFEHKTATVMVKPGKRLARADVEQALAGTDYTVTSFAADAGQ